MTRFLTGASPAAGPDGLGGMWQWLLAGALAFGVSPPSAQAQYRAPRSGVAPATSQSQDRAPRLAAATLFGLPAENGRVRWPFGLESLTPSDETQALRDQDKEVRKHSMQALLRVAVGARQAIPNLLEVLKDKDVEQRTLALTVLREIPEESDAIVRAVTPLLKDADENVRRLAKEVLAFQGKQ